MQDDTFMGKFLVDTLPLFLVVSCHYFVIERSSLVNAGNFKGRY